MFVVKKLNKNGNWDIISLIDEDGHFRGEARFESKHKAQEYLESYKERINKRLASYGMSKTRIKFQVFEIDSKTDVGSKKRKYGSFSYISSLS
jgi:hypothetical protein